ncbi:MAG: tRNA (adenosine(37)-N6)-threonylcarbamoyltransferase complex dimerization subunit type 1 TsaB [Kordiimonadaceae bacterium]|nr:tRNA (adenosine(37)-N6)-threonylcarbamoyltransferase complex dimerization subunit type 1 TsaB [Kordiimonadaceae bacterium]
MTILAIDTSETCCSAALLLEDGVSFSKQEDIGRGHAERLLPMIDELLAEAAIGFDSITRIAVVTGPGTFTGLRIGLSVARGLALALTIPCVGIMSLNVLAAGCLKGASQDMKAHVVTKGRGGQVFYQVYENTRDSVPLAVSEAVNIDADEAAALIGNPEVGLLVGSGLVLLGEEFTVAAAGNFSAVDPVVLAELSATLSPSDYPPEPSYLRPPDAIKAKAVFLVKEV